MHYLCKKKMLCKKTNTSWNQGSVCRVYSYSNYIIALSDHLIFAKYTTAAEKILCSLLLLKEATTLTAWLNTQSQQKVASYSRSPSFSSRFDLPLNDSDQSGWSESRLIFYMLQDEGGTNSFLFRLDIMELWDASPEQAGSQSHGKICLALLQYVFFILCPV